jgi:hypothetical protein
MRWPALGNIGRIIHPFVLQSAPGTNHAVARNPASAAGLIQPLHVERAHARAHPVHTAALDRPGTEFIVTVARTSGSAPR